MKHKEEIKITYSKAKMLIGLLLIGLVLAAMLLQMSDLSKIYLINFLCSIILRNRSNLLFIALILLFLQYLERRKALKKAAGTEVEKKTKEMNGNE